MRIIYKPGASCDRRRHGAARAGDAVPGDDGSWRDGDAVIREKC